MVNHSSCLNEYDTIKNGSILLSFIYVMCDCDAINPIAHFQKVHCFPVRPTKTHALSICHTPHHFFTCSHARTFDSYASCLLFCLTQSLFLLFLNTNNKINCLKKYDYRQSHSSLTMFWKLPKLVFCDYYNEVSCTCFLAQLVFKL